MFGFVSKKSYDDLADTTRRVIDERDIAIARLAKIAALETPNCASIGRRMARIAKGLD